ncbi:MAG TPA: hypothetical protein DEB24_00450 [Coriobacteriia bacterium]|nr:hypothetical protein [Coriobacteriia bacterium]
MSEALEACGLQGVELSAPKPVIVNSIHVINAGDSDVLAALGEAKKGYASLPGSGSGTVLDALMEGILVQVEGLDGNVLGGEFTLFTISFGDFPGLPEIPIKVKLPTGTAARGGSP